MQKAIFREIILRNSALKIRQKNDHNTAFTCTIRRNNIFSVKPYHVFTKEGIKELISRKFLSVIASCNTFPYCCVIYTPFSWNHSDQTFAIQFHEKKSNHASNFHAKITQICVTLRLKHGNLLFVKIFKNQFHVKFLNEEDS